MVTTGPELWICHYLGGAWRAPLGTRMACVLAANGGVAGRVVLAEQADIDRARRVQRAGRAEDDLRYRQVVQGLGDAAFHTPPPATLRQGVLYLAAPQDAPVAIRLACHIARAGLPPGTFAMLYQA